MAFDPVAVAECIVERLGGYPAHGEWVRIADPVTWMGEALDAAIALEWARAVGE